MARDRLNYHTLDLGYQGYLPNWLNQSLCPGEK